MRMKGLGDQSGVTVSQVTLELLWDERKDLGKSFTLNKVTKVYDSDNNSITDQ